jgi:glyoxylase-like metal-dependent hydrolase (beta-lactamase superfamily II)
LTDGFLTGLAARETIFSNYQKVDGIMLPFRVVTMIGGEVTNDLAYTRIKLNTHPAVTVFESPKSAEIGPEVGGPPQPITLTRLATGVYYVNAVGTGSIFFYSSMFVAFKDYVLVVEAPLSDGVSQAVIAKIKETVPGKPIKYLVPTHYHVDHLGGVRGYIAEGSIIVTTPANRNLIETLAALVHPLSPDTLSLHPCPVSIETFKDKRVFSDGEQVVELYNVGPTPHVEEMVIAYLPHQKLVFVSDMFPVNLVGRSRQADPINIFFLAKIRELGLQIEKIASGHGRVGALAELESAAQSSGH